MFYNTNIIRSTFPEVTLHRSHEPNQVNYQEPISDDVAVNDKNAIEGVIYDLDLVPTDYEAGECKDSDKENIKSVETEISISNQDHTNTKSGHTMKKSAQYNDAEFKKLMNYYILLENDKEMQDGSVKFAVDGAAIRGSFNHTSELITKKSQEAMMVLDKEKLTKSENKDHERPSSICERSYCLRTESYHINM